MGTHSNQDNDMMKIAILAAFLAHAAAAPRPDESVEVAQLLRDARTQEGAYYSTNFEVDNGIVVSETGDEDGVQGSYYWVAPNGETVELTLVANENGAVFESPSGHLPVAPLPVEAIHPVPEHAQEQIAFAAEQRAAGVEWDEQGFVIEN